MANEPAGPVPGGAEVEDLLRTGAVEAVFQPIVAIADGTIVGYESLARMRHPRIDVAPDIWIEAAHRVGLGIELELLCLKAAGAAGLPPGDARLFVNVTAPVLADRRAVEYFDGKHRRLVLEISETQMIADYDAARHAMRAWAELGARLAIDDTGSGYASLRHVLRLAPDYIKLDRTLISGIGADRNLRALASALAAFARELGAAVIAEGIEHPEELEVLRETGVDLAQGWLLARPGPPWSSAADPSLLSANGSTVGGIAASLDLAADPVTACDAAVEHLAQRSGLLPSAYLLAGDHLRCLAQRGLWQVLDGLEQGSGITGQCFTLGQEIVVADVSESAVYREAMPGVKSEACVPIRVEGMTVGALNVDSRRRLDDDDLTELRATATMLGERLAVVGRAPASKPIDRLGRHQRNISRSKSDSEVFTRLVSGALDITGMSSAVLTHLQTDGEPVVSSMGPLRHTLAEAVNAHLAELAVLVHGTTSCYTAGSVLGQAFIGMDELRHSGVRAIAVLPLVAPGRGRLGLLLVAHSDPCAFHTEEVEPLELLADYAATVLGLRRDHPEVAAFRGVESMLS